MKRDQISSFAAAIRAQARELAGSDLPVNVKELLQKRGLRVRRRKLVGSEALQVGDIVYLGDPQPSALGLQLRERFTLAHELGHVEIERMAVRFCVDLRKISEARLESLCDEFAGELLAPTTFVKRFLAERRPPRKGDALPHRVIRELASVCATSLQVACRAVCRASPSHLVVCLGLVHGKGNGSFAGRALGVKWSARSDLVPLGLFPNKRLPTDHTLVRAYRAGRSMIGVAELDLPPLEPGLYEVEFRPYRKADYLLSISTESLRWSPVQGSKKFRPR